ncbi:MAG: hypothetical protein U1F35_03260 [Steroidobacteraceae bacterium]
MPPKPSSSNRSFFDRTRVPVERIELVPEEIETLAPDQYEVIGCKTTYRLAQRPGSYVVLEYARPVIKRKDLTPCAGPQILCTPAPAGVIEGRADVDGGALGGQVLQRLCTASTSGFGCWHHGQPA